MPPSEREARSGLPRSERIDSRARLRELLGYAEWLYVGQVESVSCGFRNRCEESRLAETAVEALNVDLTRGSLTSERTAIHEEGFL